MELTSEDLALPQRLIWQQRSAIPVRWGGGGGGGDDPNTGWRIWILLFSSVAFKKTKKKQFLFCFFASYLLGYCRWLGTYIYISNHKSLRSHKTVEIKVFHNFLACWWKVPVPDPDPYKRIRIRIRNAQKFTNPTDPDPEHWFKSLASTFCQFSFSFTIYQ